MTLFVGGQPWGGGPSGPIGGSGTSPNAGFGMNGQNPFMPMSGLAQSLPNLLGGSGGSSNPIFGQGGAGGYYGQQTSPPAYQPTPSTPGYLNIQTGVNATPPSLPSGALSSLMGYPKGSIGGPSFGQQGSWNPQAANGMNQFYNQSLYANNMRGATGLQNLFNSQNAQNNFNLGNLQGQLTQQGAGMGAEGIANQLQNQLQLSNLMRGFGGGVMNNLFGLLGGLGGSL